MGPSSLARQARASRDSNSESLDQDTRDSEPCSLS